MKIMKNKKAVAFLSGSAGELDWILPILDHLSNLQFEIKIIYLTRHVKKSVNHNSLLRNYIIKPENKIEAFSTGGPVVEMIERIGLVNFLEGVGIDVDPNMVANPRESSYVRTDDWDDEAVKWYEKIDQRKKGSA